MKFEYQFINKQLLLTSHDPKKHKPIAIAVFGKTDLIGVWRITYKHN